MRQAGVTEAPVRERRHGRWSTSGWTRPGRPRARRERGRAASAGRLVGRRRRSVRASLWRRPRARRPVVGRGRHALRGLRSTPPHGTDRTPPGPCRAPRRPRRALCGARRAPIAPGRWPRGWGQAPGGPYRAPRGARGSPPCRIESAETRVEHRAARGASAAPVERPAGRAATPARRRAGRIPGPSWCRPKSAQSRSTCSPTPPTSRPRRPRADPARAGAYRELAAGAGVAGRRTVTIRGRGAERDLAFPEPGRARRPPVRRHERPGFKPDRTALVGAPARRRARARRRHELARRDAEPRAARVA